MLGGIFTVLSIMAYAIDNSTHLSNYISKLKELEIQSIRTNNNNLEMTVINHNDATAQLTALHIEATIEGKTIYWSNFPVNIKVSGRDIISTKIGDSYKDNGKTHRPQYVYLSGNNSPNNKHNVDFEKIYKSLLLNDSEECISLSILSTRNDLITIGHNNKSVPLDKNIRAQVKYRYIVAGDSKSREKSIRVSANIGLKYIQRCMEKYTIEGRKANNLNDYQDNTL